VAAGSTGAQGIVTVEAVMGGGGAMFTDLRGPKVVEEQGD
jgi:hypothetical protein